MERTQSYLEECILLDICPPTEAMTWVFAIFLYNLDKALLRRFFNYRQDLEIRFTMPKSGPFGTPDSGRRDVYISRNHRLVVVRCYSPAESMYTVQLMQHAGYLAICRYRR